MPKIPNYFYYTSAGKPIYRYNPPGKLEIIRFINSQPYWRTPYFEKTITPKKIILADWHMGYYDQEKREAINTVLKNLIQEGFSIYIWSNEKVKPLTEQMLNDLKDRHSNTTWSITQAHHDKIVEKAIQRHHFTRDQILVLDDYTLDQVLNPTLPTDRPRVLHVSHLSEVKGAKEIQIASRAYPPVSIINIDDFYTNSRGNEETAKKLQKKFPALKINHDYHSAVIASDDAAKRILDTTSISVLQNIRNLEICGDVSVSNIIKLLEAMPGLYQLTLSSAYALKKNELHFKKPILTQLKVINIECSGISIKNLNTLLAYATPKSIHFRNAGFDTDIIQLTEEQLNHLESIDIDNVTISHENLNRLLQAPNLTSLNLNNCIREKEKVIFSPIKHLKSFSGNILPQLNYENLNHFFPKLKDLTIHSDGWPRNELPSTFIPEEKHPSQNLLEEMNIRVKINNNQLSKLLSAAPNVKEIYLTDPILTEDTIDVTQSLQNLEEIHLHEGKIHIEIINKLFALAPNLKRVAFRYTEILHESKAESAILPSLQKMDLEECSLSKDQLKTLLTAASHSKQLDLRFKNHRTLQLKKNSLPKLKEVELHKDITGSELNSLFLAAPKLQKLRFNFHCQLKSIDKLPKLNHLTTIDLHYTHISEAVLNTLIDAAPNLKTIDISDTDLANYISSNTHPRLKDIKIITGIRHTNDGEHKISPPIDIPESSHDLENMLHFKPSRAPFIYRGDNHTQNQAMISEKISQYWMLTDQHIMHIPKIQNGICLALSYLFIEKNKEWKSLIETIAAWDGTLDNLNENISKSCEIISNAIVHYNIDTKTKTYYIGNHLSGLLKNKKPYVLSNPWHAIAITPIESKETETYWQIYDPNFTQGPQIIPESKLDSAIKRQLGELINISLDDKEKEPNIVPTIDSPAHFIQQGGLFILCDAKNQERLLNQLSEFKPPYPTTSLRGILLRNTKGYPAWAVALKNTRTSQYTFELLEQFVDKNENAVDLLKNSLENIPPKEQISILNLFKRQYQAKKIKRSDEKSMTNDNIMRKLFDSVRTNSHLDYYEKQLETWNKNIAKESDLPEYLKRLLNTTDKRTLIELNSSMAIQGLQLSLQKYCQIKNHPIFYIHSPEDLICSARWVKRTNQYGTVQEGPGGPLYDFLRENQDKEAIILVNYENFNPSEIDQFSSLLSDTKPQVDGVTLSNKTKIIGLTNIKNPHCYQGANLYSHFNTIEHFPISDKAFENLTLPFIKTEECKDTPATINLYHADDWLELLLGQWKIKNKQLVFEEGLLVKALRNNHILDIQNGLWDDPKFQHFWQQAYAIGFILHAGQKIDIPKDLKLLKNAGYHWKTREQDMEFKSGLIDKNIPVLNPTLFSQFFNRYQCDHSTQGLNHISGWIEAHAGKTLEINVTRELDEHQWARLFDSCYAHHVKLIVHCATPTISPVTLSAEEITHPKPPSMQTHTKIMTSTDIDVTIEQLLQDSKESWQIIDISKCTIADLLMYIDGQWDPVKGSYYFTETPRALLNGLQKNQNILLKGHFSTELADALIPFLLERLASKTSNGKLMLISDDNKTFEYLSPLQHAVTIHEKFACLKESKEPHFDEKTLATESLAQLKARQIKKDQDPWIGMRDLPPHPIYDSKTNFTESKEISDEFSKSRLQAVNQLLATEPYVFLTGLTGVGKSTFVQEEFLKTLKKETHMGTLYQGESELSAWANDKSPGRKILFIDEVNLEQDDRSEFEGLYNDPPGMLIAGNYVPLDDNHKVIFAGNPLHYGGERQLASFFIRHGNAVLFEPLPPEYIYYHILQPIFTHTVCTHQMQEISEILLNVYRYLCHCSSETILITARELQMMALFIVCHTEKHAIEGKAQIAIAEHYAYQLGKNLVPNKFQADFEKQFRPQHALTNHVEEKSHFVVTPSRQTANDLLHDIFNLRAWRLQHKNSKEMTEAQCFGGLGGVILEGEVGSGKSELITALLEIYGYEARDYRATHIAKTKNIYYYLPVSMDYQEKEKLLLKAFTEGALVIIEDITSSIMMERLLNTLLMGKAPNGLRPEQPGFMVIGTRKPATYAGQQETSPALARRLMSLSLTSYNTQELIDILLHRGVKEYRAKELVSVYEAKLHTANSEYLSPAPTVHDLMRLADEEIKLDKSMEIEKSSSATLLPFFSTTRLPSETTKIATEKSGDTIDNPHLYPRYF